MPGAFLLGASAAGSTFTGGVLDLIWQAGPVVKLVLLILFGFSFISWGIIFYKGRVLRRAMAESTEFLEIFWERRSLDLIYDEAKHLTGSPLSNIFRAGFIQLVRLKRESPQGVAAMPGAAGTHRADLPALDDVLKKIRWTSAAEVNHLEKYISFLATTGSATPFIGLFGTVWGIMDAFRHIGVKGAASISVVAPGISEALVATAIGLFAAIPAVIAYNFFVNKIRVLVKEVEGFTDDYVSDLRKSFKQEQG
ncbi:MAG: protein TolQ [Myxococcota bacterium]